MNVRSLLDAEVTLVHATVADGLEHALDLAGGLDEDAPHPFRRFAQERVADAVVDEYGEADPLQGAAELLRELRGVRAAQGKIDSDGGDYE